ncbi:VWFA and cache domain-containing protein 1-like [Ciona intestinalis]
MQAYIDTLTYVDQPLNSENLLDSIASEFGRKFQDRKAVVRRLRDAVVTSYRGTTSSNSECCRLTDSQLEFEPSFKQNIARRKRPATYSDCTPFFALFVFSVFGFQVNSGKVCERKSSNSPLNPTILQNGFKNACVQNYQNLPSLKWQYFGSEQGVTTLFPSFRTTDCGSYDNRFRPWYVQANVPKPKQVVIVIDKSASMGITNMNLAKEAAKSVVSTLNPQDRFAVIAFSNAPQTYTSSTTGYECFATSFADASPQNKKKVADFVDTIFSAGGTHYGVALRKAFSFFQRESTVSDRVILFMSDGVPTDEPTTILSTQIRENERLNNSVVILTYGLGSADFTVLRNMAANNGEFYGISKTSNASEPRIGLFTHIPHASNLRTQMSSYYNFFAVNSQGLNEPLWTTPYLDGWGLGILMTASLPVYVNNNLVGVAAVDITIEELLGESSYFRPSELSYSFVINNKGLVINHPLFSYISNVDPLLVSATAYERNAAFLSVFESMKRGESGNKTFLATRILPQGDSSKYGIREIQVMSTYSWKQIPGTQFSLCVVLAVGDTQAVLQNQQLPSPNQKFLYHRLDLVAPTTPCKHLSSYGAKDQSSVMLSPRAYQHPSQYLSKSETAADVTSLKNYMLGTGPNTANVKNSIRNVVYATSKLEQLWTEISGASQELQREILWRYIGTKEGVFRMYPGTELPKNFDPVVRPWYEHALANRDKFVITPPYRDAASGNNIITLSKVIFEGKANGFHNTLRDEVIAVMGVDFIYSHFQKLLYRDYPVCNNTQTKCLVIDLAGYVISADDVGQKSVLGSHIAEIEPKITAVLVQQGIMAQKQCSNIEGGVIQRTFKISEEQSAYSGRTSSSPTCDDFKLLPLPGTNAFIIAKQPRIGCSWSIQQTCICSKVVPKCMTTWNRFSCECPCSEPNPFFHPCVNEYLFLNNVAPPCTPENHELTSVTRTRTVYLLVSSLPNCYDATFIVSSLSPATTTPAPGKTPLATTIGLSVGIPLAILFLSILCFWCCKSSKEKKVASPPTYLEVSGKGSFLSRLLIPIPKSMLRYYFLYSSMPNLKQHILFYQGNEPTTSSKSSSCLWKLPSITSCLQSK